MLKIILNPYYACSLLETRHIVLFHRKIISFLIKIYELIKKKTFTLDTLDAEKCYISYLKKQNIHACMCAGKKIIETKSTEEKKTK